MKGQIARECGCSYYLVNRVLNGESVREDVMRVAKRLKEEYDARIEEFKKVID